MLHGSKYGKWLDSSIWLIDGTLTVSTSLGQSRLGSNSNEGAFYTGSNGNEEVLHIPQSSQTGASPLAGLVLCPGHSLVGSCPSVQVQITYSIILTDRAVFSKLNHF